MSERITAAHIRAHMTKVYAHPEWALLFEVLNATGAQHTRSADALAMSLWPSRGLTLHGFEIKVSRHDWNTERKDPSKAETIAAYCDFWSLVTAPGVVQDAVEVPPAWGWMEFDGKSFTTHRAAEKTEAKVCDRLFLAALLRRAARTDEAAFEIEIERRDAVRRAAYEADLKTAVERRTRRASETLKEIEAFEEASGLRLDDWMGWAGDAAQLGRIVKAIKATNMHDPYYGVERLAASMVEAAEKMRAAMREMGFDPLPAADTGRKAKRAAQ